MPLSALLPAPQNLTVTTGDRIIPPPASGFPPRFSLSPSAFPPNSLSPSFEPTTALSNPPGDTQYHNPPMKEDWTSDLTIPEGHHFALPPAPLVFLPPPLVQDSTATDHPPPLPSYSGCTTTHRQPSVGSLSPQPPFPYPPEDTLYRNASASEDLTGDSATAGFASCSPPSPAPLPLPPAQDSTATDHPPPLSHPGCQVPRGQLFSPLTVSLSSLPPFPPPFAPLTLPSSSLPPFSPSFFPPATVSPFPVPPGGALLRGPHESEYTAPLHSTLSSGPHAVPDERDTSVPGTAGPWIRWVRDSGAEP